MYSGGQLVHWVAPGQTLSGIARTYDVDVNDIVRLNHISNPNKIEKGTKLLIPRSAGGYPSFTPSSRDFDRVRREVWALPSGFPWQTITIHHTATSQGDAALFHKDHLKRGMGGLFYHFVIGNGKGSGDGHIEVGFRWRQQLQVKRPHDIQICLVGDFTKTQPTLGQMRSLTALVIMLQEKYAISSNKIRRHGDLPDANSECPGTKLPFKQLLQIVH